jgi:hypothetical protein
MKLKDYPCQGLGSYGSTHRSIESSEGHRVVFPCAVGEAQPTFELRL